MAVKTQSARFSLERSPSVVNSGQGWTAETARAWLRVHDLRGDKLDRTVGQLRFRQFEPSQCLRGSFSTLTRNLPRGVQLLSCDDGT